MAVHDASLPRARERAGRAEDAAGRGVPARAARNASGAAPGGRLALLVVLVVFAALPFLVSDFTTFQLTKVLIYAIAILGLNLLTGINGQFSLGHGAFYAVGAYATAMLMYHFEVPYLLTLPVAAVLCFAVGFLFGLPALRLEPIYLALATFALAIATPQLLKLSIYEEWTGGVQGLFLLKPYPPFDLPISPDQWLYFLSGAVGLFLYWVARNVVASRTGRALMAIRDNPFAARSMGINTALYKSLAFGLSAAFTGVAGALGAIVISFVAPDSFTFAVSIGFFVGLVVGGVGWLPGALIGGAFLVYVPNIAEEIQQGLSGAIYGVILILLVYVMPSGAGGLLRTLVGRLGRRGG